MENTDATRKAEHNRLLEKLRRGLDALIAAGWRPEMDRINVEEGFTAPLMFLSMHAAEYENLKFEDLAAVRAKADESMRSVLDLLRDIQRRQGENKNDKV
jgi:hypothetical protein